MTNLIDSVKDMMTGAVIDKASSLIGLDRSTTSSAMSKFLPAIIGGLISKGNTENGAATLINLFKSGGYGNTELDLTSTLSDPAKAESLLSRGSDVLSFIFGDNQSSVLDTLTGVTGVKKSEGSMLMKLIAPIVVNKLASMVYKNNWGANKLSTYLSDQKSSISGLVPGMSAMLGFAGEATSNNTSNNTSNMNDSVNNNENEGGSGLLKWLLPLILALGAIWFLTKDGCGNTAGDDTTLEESLVDSTDLDDDDEIVTARNIDYSQLTVTSNGNIVNSNGTVIYAEGTYGLDGSGNLIGKDGRVLVSSQKIPNDLHREIKSHLGKYSGKRLTLDNNGNLVDDSGTIVVKKGDFVEKDGFYYDKQGNKLGRIWSDIVKAVGDAAEKTVDAMKTFFSRLVKKESGFQTTYVLTNIVFDQEDHRIKSFSKGEVEGLAAALKDDADGRIIVQATTSDGEGDKENKELSKTRARVVHDMLVTLGVNKDQISYEGMGSGDNKVLIRAK